MLAVSNNKVIFHYNGNLISVDSSNKDFELIKAFVLADDFEKAAAIYNKDYSVIFAQQLKEIQVKHDGFYVGDIKIDDNNLKRKINEMLNLGCSEAPIVKFIKKLYDNPNKRSRETFYNYVKQYDITVDQDGDVILYKGVCDDYYDKHSHTILNKPGCIVSMPREEVDHDPDSPCSTGLHAGTIEYATDWGERVVAVKVDPKDVCCVPYDESFQKVRVCKYIVLAEIEDRLSVEVKTKIEKVKENDKCKVKTELKANDKKEKVLKKARRKWSEKEYKILEKLYRQGKTPYQIAKVLGRGVRGIYHKIYERGLA